MGSMLASIWGKLFRSDKSYSILIVGLANAGKTTLLYRMYNNFLQVGHLVKQSKQHPLLEAMSNRLPIKM